MKGIDISPWNGQKVNFAAIKAAGYEFVYIKASQGPSLSYPCAIVQDQDAIGEGLEVGFYHFAQPGQDSATDEAHLFDMVLRKGNYTLLPVVDVETNAAGIAPAQYTQWLHDFVATLQSLGYPRVMIYGGKYFLNANILPDGVLATCPLWLADYEANAHLPNGWAGYAVWQYSQSAQIPGIGGVFDVDVCDALPV
jgi:lysozyme